MGRSPSGRRGRGLAFACLGPIILASWCTYWPLSETARGAILPTEGTFRDFYHRDRFGVARFKFFLVHPSLLPKLAPYEGRYIEVEVTKGIQPVNPGPAIMLEVGRVVELPQPPVKLALSTVPSSLGEQRPCQLLLRVRNTGEAPLTLEPNQVTLSLRHAAEDRQDREDIFGSGYKQNQFAATAGGWQLRSIALSVPWRRHHILGHPSDCIPRLTLGPGEVFPFCIALDNGLAKGRYEVGGGVSLYLDRDKPAPASAWLAFDVPGPERAEPEANSGLRLTHSPFRLKDEWASVNLRLANEGTEPRSIPQCLDNEAVRLWVGRLHGFSRDGGEVPLTFNYPVGGSKGSPDSCRIVRVPKSGLETALEFRAESMFSDAPIARLSCDILTDRGLETFPVADDFKDETFAAPPPFGPEKGGLKLRIRTHHASYAPNQLIRLYWQLVNLEQKPLVLRASGGWRVEMDGRTVAKPGKDSVSGWATERGPYPPQEHWIELQDLSLAPGRHTVRLICESGSPLRPTYTNADGKEISISRGVLESNAFEFAVGGP